MGLSSPSDGHCVQGVVLPPRIIPNAWLSEGRLTTKKGAFALDGVSNLKYITGLAVPHEALHAGEQPARERAGEFFIQVGPLMVELKVMIDGL